MGNSYNLDKTQEELIAPLKNFAHSELPKLCKLAFESKTAFPNNIFSELSALGLAGLSISEEYGGIGSSPAFQASVYDTISEQDLGPAIFTSVHGMVSGLIERFGSVAQKEQLLPLLAAGERLGAFALSETEAGSDAANLKCSYSKDAAGYYILNGDKCWITSAGFADVYVVFAREKGTTGKQGVSAFLVEKEVAGLSIGQPEKKMGCELSPIGTLTFENAKLSGNSLLGQEGSGLTVAYSGLTGGRINIAACANGLSRAALNATVRYVKQRKAFSGVLSDLQGVQFKLADMQTALSAAELMVGEAARLLEVAPTAPRTRSAAAQAKLFATDTAMSITTDAVQLHGAFGYMREGGIEKLMRDAKMLQIVEGANEVQRSIIARMLLDEV